MRKIVDLLLALRVVEGIGMMAPHPQPVANRISIRHPSLRRRRQAARRPHKACSGSRLQKSTSCHLHIAFSFHVNGSKSKRIVGTRASQAKKSIITAWSDTRSW